MKKIALIVSVVVLFAAVASFVGGLKVDAAEVKKIVVGLSWNEKRHALVEAWEDYMKQYSKEYGKEHGIEFEWIVTVADSDPAQQNSNIENLIIEGVDIIVARPHDTAAIGAAIRAAHEAGIPFVTFDRECSTVTPDAHVGADSYNHVRSIALYFAGLLKGMGIKGKVIELMGDLRDMNAVWFHKAWHDVEDQLGAWETVAEVPTRWDPEKYYTGTVDALRAHPEANCIFVHSDFAFPGVETALRNAGRFTPAGEKGHMWIATIMSDVPGYEAMLKGYIDVSTVWDAYVHAVKIVEVLGKIAKGEDLGGKRFLVTGRIVTRETLEKVKHLWIREYKD